MKHLLVTPRSAPWPDAAPTILHRRDGPGQEVRSLGLIRAENLVLHSLGVLKVLLLANSRCDFRCILLRRRFSLETLLRLMQCYRNGWLSPIRTQDLWSSLECPLGSRSYLLPGLFSQIAELGWTASSRKSSGRCPRLVFNSYIIGCETL